MGEIDTYLEARGRDILADGVLVENTRDGGATPVPEESAPEGPVDASSEAAGGTDKVELDLPRLASYDRILQRYALRSALRRLEEDLRGIGYQHIDALVGLCQPGARGRKVELPGGITGLREGRILSIWKGAPESLAAVDPLELPVPGRVRVPGSSVTVTTRIVSSPGDGRALERRALTARFDLDRVEQPLVIRSRRPGDRILGLGLPRATKVKNLLIDARIPRRLREGVPILADRSRVLWIAGVRRSAHALVNDDTTRVLEVTLSSPMFSPGRS